MLEAVPTIPSEEIQNRLELRPHKAFDELVWLRHSFIVPVSKAMAERMGTKDP